MCCGAKLQNYKIKKSRFRKSGILLGKTARFVFYLRLDLISPCGLSGLCFTDASRVHGRGGWAEQTFTMVTRYDTQSPTPWAATNSTSLCCEPAAGKKGNIKPYGLYCIWPTDLTNSHMQEYIQWLNRASLKLLKIQWQWWNFVLWRCILHVFSYLYDCKSSPVISPSLYKSSLSHSDHKPVFVGRDRVVLSFNTSSQSCSSSPSPSSRGLSW